MDDTISASEDHSHDQHEYPIDYADHDEDFGLADHDSLDNIDFEIDENENEFIDDEEYDTIADDNIDLQKEAGFDVRLGTIRTTKSDIITQRHLLCNWEDKPRTAQLDTLDPQHSINKAVTEVLPISSHRFCLWNITKQLRNKITSEVATNSDFRKRFHSIIWNSKLEPHDFDNVWQSYLDDFNISNNKWMKEMYGLQRRWVPVFFKDIPMPGLMRTTFLSTGQNWSFQNNTLSGCFLLLFMMTFEGVMECQRRNQVVNDSNTAITVPRFITSSPNKAHASKVYTRKIFYQVQKEISNSENTCFQMSVTSCNGVDTIIVLKKQENISTMQPTSPVVDDKLEEYHYDCLTKDTQYTVCYDFII
ncbi:unnamed protein product [Lactuca saligna]|uniref:Protein FAR1-RELATED SEQUENCE n=1 Tax=Lactuca saligna TaxID=75948 RepID=A0AA36EMG6_LACSI|nr:unnamed protein product [Lactuca saligna]